MIGGKSILVDSVHKSLEDAKRDEPPQVDIGEHVRVCTVPFADTLTLFQRGEELDDADAVDGFTGRI